MAYVRGNESLPLHLPLAEYRCKCLLNAFSFSSLLCRGGNVGRAMPFGNVKFRVKNEHSGGFFWYCVLFLQLYIPGFNFFFFVFSTYRSNGVGLLQDLVNVEYQLM